MRSMVALPHCPDFAFQGLAQIGSVEQVSSRAVWISLEDERSVDARLQSLVKLMKQRGLAGICRPTPAM
jgi:hypothetical protein